MNICYAPCMPQWVWQKWLIKAVVMLCLPVLASCVYLSEELRPPRPTQPSECLDVASEEKDGEIVRLVDSERDEDVENAVADFDDKLLLQPFRENDGQCAVDPAAWTPDCVHDMFRAMRHQTLVCAPIASGIALVRQASENYYPEENIIALIQAKNTRWNGPARTVEREGDNAVSRVPLFKIVTTETENENGTTTTEEHCELDNRHIEVRADYVFKKTVEFIAKTLHVPNPCSPTTPAQCQEAALADIAPDEWVGDCQGSFPSYVPPPGGGFRFKMSPRFTCRPTDGGVELVLPATSPECEDIVIMTIRGINQRIERDAMTLHQPEGDDLITRAPFNDISSIIGLMSFLHPPIVIGAPPCDIIDWHLEIRGGLIFEHIIRFVADTLELSYGPCTTE